MEKKISPTKLHTHAKEIWKCCLLYVRCVWGSRIIFMLIWFIGARWSKTSRKELTQTYDETEKKSDSWIKFLMKMFSRGKLSLFRGNEWVQMEVDVWLICFRKDYFHKSWKKAFIDEKLFKLVKKTRKKRLRGNVSRTISYRLQRIIKSHQIHSIIHSKLCGKLFEYRACRALSKFIYGENHFTVTL